MKYDIKRFLNNKAAAFARWRTTRYGADALSKALATAGLALWLLSQLLSIRIFYRLAWLLLLVSGLRTFAPAASWQKRRKELAFFNRHFGRTWQKVCGYLNYLRLSVTDRSHKYLRCSSCGKYLRVPRGQGTISVNCPYCRNKTKTRS
ncbi:MAG: hypothetical protein HUJ80_05215 [Firmicutes bacterium]|nr:hypothetical protein [Bacillota bacterium]